MGKHSFLQPKHNDSIIYNNNKEISHYCDLRIYDFFFIQVAKISCFHNVSIAEILILPFDRRFSQTLK